MSRLRIGLLGCGGIMGKHVKEIVAAPREAELVAMCDVSDVSMDRLIERCMPQVEANDLPPRFHEPERMLNDVSMDALVIATPHTLHAAQCTQALEAGLHVLVEKPMVTDLAEAERLETLVERTGRVLTVAYNTPCTANFQYLQRVRREKTFGDLKLATLWCSQPWYHATKNTWRQKPELSGGGMLYDTGAHVLNSLTWVVERDVRSVHAQLDHLDAPVEINGSMNVRFAGGTMATVTICGETINGAGAAFMFEDALIEVNPWQGTDLRVYAGEGGDRRKKTQLTPELDTAAGTTPMSNFIKAIRGEAEPATTARHGVIQSQLMDAVYASARSGQPAEPNV